MQKNTPVQDQAIKYQVLRLNRSNKAPFRSVIYAILTEQFRQNTFSFSHSRHFDWTVPAKRPFVQSHTPFWLNRSPKAPLRSVIHVILTEQITKIASSFSHKQSQTPKTRRRRKDQQQNSAAENEKLKKIRPIRVVPSFTKPATLALRARSFVRTVSLHSALYAVPFSTLAALTKKTDRFAVCLLRKPATSYFSRRSPTKYHRRKGA